jgi:mono/diheme cytochrome c family protein
MARSLLLPVLLALAVLALVGLMLFGRPPPRPARLPTPQSSASPRIGNPARGQELARRFECSRCHTGTGTDDAPQSKSCAGCHRAIHAGTFGAGALTFAHWVQRIRHFLHVPSLAGAPGRFRRGWLESYLMNPVDLRPGLEESMPRLELDVEQARDLAAYFAPDDPSGGFEPAGDPERGRALLELKGCATCHRLSGAPPLRVGTLPVAIEPGRLRLAAVLAPDLRWTRERLLPDYLLRWLRKPSAVRADALMPDVPLDDGEIRDIATYLLTAKLDELPSRPPSPLPLLSRAVLWEEVERRVFRDSCWHCHSDPDYARGDGGPGNSGGFGFAGKRINLADHGGLLSGYVDASGERRSLFELDPALGKNRLVAALWARHAEEHGQTIPGIRGMPLGLPALPVEEIQLVETWIAQGRSQ